MPTATLIARGGDAKILHTMKASSRTSSLQKSTTSSSTSSSSGGNGDAGGSVGEGSRGDGRSTMIVAPPSSSSPRLRLYTHPGCSKQALQGGECAAVTEHRLIHHQKLSPPWSRRPAAEAVIVKSTPFGACLCGMIPCYPVLFHDEAQLVMAHRHHLHLQLQQQARMMEAQLVMAHHHHQLQLQQQARMPAYHQSRVIHQDDPNASLIDDDDDVPIMAMYKSKKKAEQRAKKAEKRKRKPKLVHKATPQLKTVNADPHPSKRKPKLVHKVTPPHSTKTVSFDRLPKVAI